MALAPRTVRNMPGCLSRESAAALVERVREFGQNDDIAVLTITRLAARRKAFAAAPTVQLTED